MSLINHVLANAVKKLNEKRAGAMPMPGGQLPPDPSMMGGAPPMDPSMMGGAPPMDPAMMGGAPPMDPSMGGGMPPAPPMDPSMMGGAPPMDPAMLAMLAGGAGAQEEEDKGFSQKQMDQLQEMITEAVMSKGTAKSDDSDLGKKVERLESQISTMQDMIDTLLGTAAPAEVGAPPMPEVAAPPMPGASPLDAMVAPEAMGAPMEVQARDKSMPSTKKLLKLRSKLASARR